LSDTVRQFRVAVQNPQSKDTAMLAKQLHARLVAPLGLPAQGKLLVVPHGVLHYLPFNALRDAKGDMIDRYSMRLLPSASVLTFLHQRKAGGKGLLVLGNPDLGNPQYDLPGAQKEAAEIARLRPDTTLLMRASATKAAVKAEGGKYAYLHFASHGKFNPERPLQSGLYLAGREEEGMLTVDELYSLNLNADLVTLSACETALGSIDNGDDVIGLTRGFFYAGASSIIASLWPVDDEATYQMMTKFYSDLARTSKADALRIAQLAVKAKYPHPFYWAAFQLTGNAR
jgi:CHAT domain-containing protein